MKGRRQLCRVAMLCVVAVLACGRVHAESNPFCGPECLYTALIALGVEPGTYTRFLERVGDVDARGTSLGELAELAEEFGLSTLAVQTSLDNLQRRQQDPPFACIAHVDGDHFVLIGEVLPNAVWTVTPPGEGLVAAPVFEQRWRGHALLLSRSPLRAEEDLPQGNTGWVLWGLAAGIAILLGMLGWGIVHRARSHQ